MREPDTRHAHRRHQLQQALFRGDALTLNNPAYLRWVQVFTEELAQTDRGSGDLTVEALAVDRTAPGEACVLAAAPGVVAGLDEVRWFYTAHGLRARTLTVDGAIVRPAEELLRVEGARDALLGVERVGLNLLQRMSGIATATRRLQEQVRRYSPGTAVVATRKTPWGLLDKRAVALGGGGTHRLGLWDALLIKTNHLEPLSASEEQAIPLALERVWPSRGRAAFVEVEVTGLGGALAAARTFRRLQQADGDSPPCLVMLDNMGPDEVARVVQALGDEGLAETVLVEASGQISEATVKAYAAARVDAISLGSLTHSARALDLRQKLR